MTRETPCAERHKSPPALSTTTSACTSFLTIGHTYSDETDTTCDICGAEKEITYRDVYTLSQTKNTSNNSYDGKSSIKSGDITWDVYGNTSETPPWRFGGGKNTVLSSVDRKLESTTTFATDVDRIELTLGNITNSGSTVLTVNKVTVEVFTNSETKHTTQFDWEAGKILTVDKPAGTSWKNCKYRIIFTISTNVTGKNSFCTIGDLKLQVVE